MEDVNTEEVKQDRVKDSNKGQGVGVAYPIDTVDSFLESAKRLVEEYGSSRPITKEEISKTLNKKINSLSLFFSSLGQYNIFTVVHGKGYLPSDIYRKYTEPVHDQDEYKAKLLMFQSAPLYAKIIEQLNGHQLPADEKRFANLLKGDPYNVNPNSAERAAKVFFDNCRGLNLRDSTGKFKFPNLSNLNGNGQQFDSVTPPPPGGKPDSQDPDDSFTLPIQLGGTRKASLTYPKKLTKKDIRIIAKALEFVATSIIENDNEDSEIKINVTDNSESKKETT